MSFKDNEVAHLLLYKFADLSKRQINFSKILFLTGFSYLVDFFEYLKSTIKDENLYNQYYDKLYAAREDNTNLWKSVTELAGSPDGQAFAKHYLKTVRDNRGKFGEFFPSNPSSAPSAATKGDAPTQRSAAELK